MRDERERDRAARSPPSYDEVRRNSKDRRERQRRESPALPGHAVMRRTSRRLAERSVQISRDGPCQSTPSVRPSPALLLVGGRARLALEGVGDAVTQILE